MKQLLNDWQIKGQQKKQFHGAVKALKNQQNARESKLSTDTAIMQAIQQQNKTKATNAYKHSSKEIDKYNHSPTKQTEKKSANNDPKLRMKQNIKIINGSKVIQQIDHLMDIEHFEDAIYLTEKALKIMDHQFGHNLIEKIHNLIPTPMYFLSHHLDKNQNPNSHQSLQSLANKDGNSKHKSNDKQSPSPPKKDNENTNNTPINVNYNININLNINVNNASSFLPTAPSIQHSYNDFNNILSQFKLNTNNLSPLIDAANNDHTQSQKSTSPTNSIRQCMDYLHFILM